MKEITIIMPYLNEGQEPLRTVESIYDTTSQRNFEIISIDDFSDVVDVKVVNKLKGFPEVNWFRVGEHVNSQQRIGVDACRDVGIKLAKAPIILIIDAHMRFKNDQWLEKMIDSVRSEIKTMWCATCLGLDENNLDVNNPKGKYYGADIVLVDKNAIPNRPAREVLEPKWKNKVQDGIYELPCILGANYFFSKQWYSHIKGLEGLRMWGSSEPFLSMKSWMAGGTSKINTDIEIGHKFRNNAPYTTQISSLVYNKMYICKTIMPEKIGQRLMGNLPHNKNFKSALELIHNNSLKIKKAKEYYSEIFNRTFEEFCENFNIPVPQ